MLRIRPSESNNVIKHAPHAPSRVQQRNKACSACAPRVQQRNKACSACAPRVNLETQKLKNIIAMQYAATDIHQVPCH